MGRCSRDLLRVNVLRDAASPVGLVRVKGAAGLGEEDGASIAIFVAAVYDRRIYLRSAVIDRRYRKASEVELQSNLDLACISSLRDAAECG